MSGAAPLHVTAPPATLAEMVWPARQGHAMLLRGAVLAFGGACLLTASAKILVPGPINMTLQTLAVLALGALLGARLAAMSVLVYVLEGALGLPVFTNTPPLPAGLLYLAGPTGGFLAGFAVAAAMVGAAADRGWMVRPILFGLVLLAADAVMLALGCTWLATLAQVAPGVTGIGFAKAFAVGVQPFLLGETIKVALAAIALPMILARVGRLLQR